MIRRLLPLILLSFLPLGATQTAPIALRSGEALVYRVSWGVFPHAGEITIAAREGETAGLPQIEVHTLTSTKGFIRKLYPFDGQAESFFDAHDGRLLLARANTSAGRKQTKASIIIDEVRQTAHYVDHLRPDRSGDVTVPPGRPMDLITSLVQTRDWDLSTGQQRPMVILFDRDFYEMTVTAERVETIETPQGPVAALLLVPRMNGTPKGMFKRGGEVKVWISQDGRRLPIKFIARFPFGTATATLVEHRSPTT